MQGALNISGVEQSLDSPQFVSNLAESKDYLNLSKEVLAANR